MTSNNKETSVTRIFELLEGEYPDARIALNFSNPVELLIATILSAQCTDRRVNMVTDILFKKYTRPEDYANVDLEELERDIKPTGFYRNKAKTIKKSCKILVDKYQSQVPRTMKNILELPGVARKTTNIVLSNAYDVIEGIAVDTHVRRISGRLGLSVHKNPDKIEKDLMDILPRYKWIKFTNLITLHGRNICTARRPKCNICVINSLCPFAFNAR